MEFLNIGGGELLVIILLAIILFGPEDILRIMRKIGSYTRKIQQMWAQISAGLKGEFIPEDIVPEEIRETIAETKASVDEVKTTLAEVQTTVQADIDDTKTTVAEVKETLNEVDTSVKADIREIPKTMRAAAKEAITTKKEDVESAANEPSPETVQRVAALLKSSGNDVDTVAAPDTVETPESTSSTSSVEDVTEPADVVPISPPAPHTIEPTTQNEEM